MIKNISIEERTNKDGKAYKVLVIEWANGYVFTTFVNAEQAFLIEMNFKNK